MAPATPSMQCATMFIDNIIPKWPPELILIISQTIGTPWLALLAREFTFKLTMVAATNNFSTLERHGLCLTTALKANANSPLGYGSEFQSPKLLWLPMKSILTHGSSWPLNNLDSTKCKDNLQEALSLGHHKGASQKPELLWTLIMDNVEHGFCLPIPLSKLPQLPGVLLAPMNIMCQHTIDKNGKIIEKGRLTQNQSFHWKPSKTSVNSQVCEHDLQHCMFGCFIWRITNWAVAAHEKYPGIPILASKVDYKSTYRQCCLLVDIAIQSCTQVMDLSLCCVLPLVDLHPLQSGVSSPSQYVTSQTH